MPLTCADIGTGEPWPQILDTVGAAFLNRVTSIAVGRQHDEGALMTRTVCGSPPRSTAVRFNLLRPCSSAGRRHRCLSTAIQ